MSASSPPLHDTDPQLGKLPPEAVAGDPQRGRVGRRDPLTNSSRWNRSHARLGDQSAVAASPSPRTRPCLPAGCRERSWRERECATRPPRRLPGVSEAVAMMVVSAHRQVRGRVVRSRRPVSSATQSGSAARRSVSCADVSSSHLWLASPEPQVAFGLPRTTVCGVTIPLGALLATNDSNISSPNTDRTSGSPRVHRWPRPVTAATNRFHARRGRPR